MFETLAHYKILDRIGAGGMGEVYRARDTRLGRTVAIKVLMADVAGDPDRRERFLREARATAALSHPNIAALYEIGEDQDQLFLVFEFVPGETLKNVIAGRPLNPRRAIDIAVQIADAIADAHAEGIVHRDIKPDNIIVTPKGNAKVLDFGLARWTAGGAERDQAAEGATMMATGVGTTLDTVAYMSPEQALGEQVDHRTDIFSLGIVLFEMLTGKLPFAGATPTALALQIVQAPAPAPSTVNKSLPIELDAIVGKALAKSLDQRYESAVTLSAELRAIAAVLDVRSDSHAATSVPVAVLPPRRSAAGWIVPLLVLAAFGAAAWYERSALQRIWRHTIGPAPAPVIAVLPLELSDHDASQTYFADGLTEDLITRLGQTPGLKVIGRSATRTYRGRAPRDVAHELGAGAVLTGSVRPSPDAIKISLELIDPSDGTAIWAGQYTRDVKDIFAVQAQIASEVATALRVKLRPTPSSARAASRLVEPRAYELYLHGRQATVERRLPEAINFYTQAMAADAGLAEAFAGLAEALHFDVVSGGRPDDTAHRQRLRDAAERAFQLDPDLPQANLAMGLTADTLKDALQYLRRAIELDASYAEACHLIGDQIQDFDPERAARFYRRSLELDASFDASRDDLASIDIAAGRWDDARRELEPISTRYPHVLRETSSAFIDLDEHQFVRALERLGRVQMDTAPPYTARVYVIALRSAGRGTDALQEATRLVGRFPQFCEGRALLAGLRMERGQVGAARLLADPILQAAREDAAAPAELQCAAVAAAAMGDAPQVAAILNRIASNEPALRYWALNRTGRGSLMLRGRWYPWTTVVDKPTVAAAKQRLDAAYAREREVARSVLAGLP